MRIGIDARFFGPQETGIGRYVERLISHLEAIDDRHEYVVFLRSKAWELWQPKNARWSKRLADAHWYTVAEQVEMPRIFRQAQLDLLHVPHFNVPLFYRGPFVVTIHDLILDQFPTERATTLEPLLFKVKFAAYQAVVRHAIRNSQAVITVSEHSRQDVLRRFNIDPQKVHVTYESVDPLPEPAGLEVLSEHGVRQPYLLHVGNSYPHKNLERFMEGVRIANTRGERFQVVLVGKRDYFSLQLEAFVKRLGLDNVVFYGFASDQELAGLYAHARAYFFPSLSEGFGLPGLEAMQVGLPLFASQATCLPEVFGPAARYFDPHSAASMAHSIETALHDTLATQQLVVAGREQLRKYSWRQMAVETLRLYERLERHGRTPTSHPTQ
ncbi:MAG: glycosyltransferase family 4 protein [Candidatus Kerfeldbacteria bacterium]|nr:glycosyltransferase family 4 protein [Candidatus Kerfeldbacteria bacterium]